MAAVGFGYAQIVPPSPINDIPAINQLNTAEVAAVALLGVLAHQFELGRVDTYTESAQGVSGSVSSLVAADSNTREVAFFNNSSAPVYIGISSSVSASSFLTELLPNSYHKEVGDITTQGFWAISPGAASGAAIAVTVGKHNPSLDQYTPGTSTSSTTGTTTTSTTATSTTAPATVSGAAQTATFTPTAISSSGNTAITYTLPTGWGGKAVTYHLVDASTGNYLSSGTETLPANGTDTGSVASWRAAGAVVGNQYYMAWVDNTGNVVRTPNMTLST